MLSSTTCDPVQGEHNGVQVSRSSTRTRIFPRTMLKGLHQRGKRSSMLPEQHFQPAYINLLPTELLTDILLYVLPEERRTIIRPFTRYPHMTLSHVCHHWRDTLFSMPSIWKSFTVAEQDPEQENKRLKRIIDRTFGRERARQASLRGLTHFWFSRMSSAQLARVVIESSSRSILPVLVKNLGRCEGLTLKLDQGSANDLLSIFTGDTSSLRTLCAVSCPEEEEAKVIYEAIMNSKALFESSHWQHLTRLSWYCQLMPFALVNLSIPQLKVLCIGSTITLEESLRFLSGCQHLMDVELSDLRIVQKPSSLPVDKQLVLPSLHTLNIHCHMGEDPLDASTASPFHHSVASHYALRCQVPLHAITMHLVGSVPVRHAG
ncbi:hypothetical protein Hypma_001810 [Hypsizygus marmoreus]|uniref:F-box domain-containing protein n=1 Tax=Hypsizygus marmoreus TaxID=39966 RepID=A0A369J5X7_HYPMA|nr:hypothetical protein Hypma_001810 [Hypsizygus marmoreus]